jgi:prepilin-type N-terminal cleavage/methylation domain-containing protein
MMRRISHSQEGFSLVEMLMVVLILTIATTCMAGGIGFALRSYHQSRTQSSARMLVSTLKSAIEHELTDTTTVTLADDDSVESFFNTIYGDSSLLAVTVDGTTITPVTDGGFGELYLGGDDGGQLLVSSAAYSSYHLGARVVSLRYDRSMSAFVVSLEVALNGNVLESSTFDVRPTNSLVMNYP